MKEEFKHILDSRIDFVLQDAKTYIYVRKEGLQESEGLGGGNFATAYALFALFNLISKVHYYLHKPSKFVSPDKVRQVQQLKQQLLEQSEADNKKLIRDSFMVPRELQTNELNAFVEFARELEETGLVLRLEHVNAHDDFATIWNGFRNMLAHLATVQDGKGIMAYELKKYWPDNINKSTSIDTVLREIRQDSDKFPPFFYVNSRSGWIMNIDALVAILDDVRALTNKCLDESTMTDDELDKLSMLLKPE